MKKRIPQKSSRKPLAIAVLVLLALNIGAAALVKADDAPLISSKRLSISGQVGVDWERPTNIGDTSERFPAARLVTVYRLWGFRPGQERLSTALVMPIQLGMNSDHPLRGGVFFSVCLYSGAD
jgi:hypothetical protein